MTINKKFILSIFALSISLSFLLVPQILQQKSYAATKSISVRVSALNSAGSSIGYPGGGVVLVKNTASGSTASCYVSSSGTCTITGLIAGTASYSVTLSPPGNYRVLANPIYLTFSSGTANANFVIQQIASNTGSGSTSSGTTKTTQKVGGRVYYSTSDGSFGVSNVGIKITNRISGSTAYATTNSSGNYLFDGLVGSSYQVSMSGLYGYSLVSSNPQNITVSSGGYSTVNFRVQKITPTSAPKVSKSIQGLVYTLDTYGKTTGIQGVKVTIKNTESNSTANQTTNTSGNYIFSGLVGQKYNVSIVVPPGYKSSNSLQTITLPSNGKGTVSFLLEKDTGSRSVTGRVYYQDSLGNSIGVPGASVKILNTDTQSTATTTTSSTGNYKFGGLVGTHYSVSITAPGGYTLSSANPLMVILGSNGQGTASFKLVQSTTSASRTVSGRVYYQDSSGASVGVQSVKVTIENADSGSTAIQGTSTTGEYKFGGLVGTHYSVSILTPNGYTASSANPLTVTLGSNGQGTASFRLTKNPSAATYTISGTVTSGSDGKPISGIQIRAGLESSGQLFVYNNATTGSDGKYLITTPLTGPLTLRALPSDSSPFQGAISNPTITFSDTSAKNVVRDFRLTPKSSTPTPSATKTNLTIKALASTGTSAPIQGATAYVCYADSVILQTGTSRCQNGNTDSTGSKTFSVLTNTPVNITVSKTGFQTAIKSTTMSTTSKTIAISLSSTTSNSNGPYTVSGTVTSAEDKKPISGMQVSIISDPVSGNIVQQTEYTNSSGKYSISTQLRGTFTVKVIPDSSSPYQGETSNSKVSFDSTTASSATRNFQLSLKDSASANSDKTIIGTIRTLDSNGQEVTYPGGGSVLLTNTKSNSTKNVSVVNGSYTLTGLADNEQNYKITYTPPNGYTVTSANNIEFTMTGGTRKYDFVIRPNTSSNSVKYNLCFKGRNSGPTATHDINTVLVSFNGSSSREAVNGCRVFTFPFGSKLTISATATGYLPLVKSFLLSKSEITDTLVLTKDERNNYTFLRINIYDAATNRIISDPDAYWTINGNSIRSLSGNNNIFLSVVEPNKTYTVSAHAPGYDSKSDNLKITVDRGGTQYYDFYLNKSDLTSGGFFDYLISILNGQSNDNKSGNITFTVLGNAGPLSGASLNLCPKNTSTSACVRKSTNSNGEAKFSVNTYTEYIIEARLNELYTVEVFKTNDSVNQTRTLYLETTTTGTFFESIKDQIASLNNVFTLPDQSNVAVIAPSEDYSSDSNTGSNSDSSYNNDTTYTYTDSTSETGSNNNTSSNNNSNQSPSPTPKAVTPTVKISITIKPTVAISSGTPSPTEANISLTPSPTKQTITSTPKPTNTPKPTATSTPFPTTKSDFKLVLPPIYLQGIGLGGDESNASASGNTAPVNKNPMVNVKLTDISASNIIYGTGIGNLEYNDEGGFFSGVININKSIADGEYNLEIKIPKYLTKTIKIKVDKKTAITSTASSDQRAVLIVGDLNGDNTINVLDYGIIFSCYGSKQDSQYCTSDMQSKADLNDDGIINYIDYNTFLRQLKSILNPNQN